MISSVLSFALKETLRFFLHLLGALIDGDLLWKRAPGYVQTLEGN